MSRTRRAVRRGLRPVVLLLAGVLATAAPAAAGSTDEAIAGITDIRSDEDLLRFVVTTSGLPEGTDLGAAPVDVAFEPADGEPVALDASAEPIASSADVPRQTAVLAVDVSGSLGAEGLQDVRDAVERYLTVVPEEVEVALVTFGEAELLVPPTTDRDAVRDALAEAEPSQTTGLYDAVALAAQTLPGVGSERIVVLTDGEDEGAEEGTPGSETTREGAVAAVQGSGAELTAIAFGDQASTEVLQGLADAGRGQFVEADGSDDLDEAFDVAATAFATDLEVRAAVPPALAGRQGNVVVTLRAGGQTLTDVAFTTLTAAPPPSVAPSPEPVPSAVEALPVRPVAAVAIGFGGPAWAGLLGLSLALGTVAAILLTGSRRQESPADRRRRQLSYYTLSGARTAAGATARPARTTRLGANPVARSAVQLADRVVDRGGGLRTLGRRLEVADVPLRPAEWVVLQVAGAVAGGLLLLLVSGGNLLACVLGLVLGAVAPTVYLAVRERRRRVEFLRLLPETLGLVASGLRAGYSVVQSLEAVVREGREPMRAEFNRALVEMRLGADPDDALEGIAGRMQSQDFRWVVMAIRIHREVGGNLSEILDTVGGTLRERSRLRRQVDVLSAEGRLSAWIIGLLPVVFSGYLVLARPEYLVPLYATELGRGLLVLGAVLFVVGVFGLRWAVKVEV